MAGRRANGVDRSIVAKGGPIGLAEFDPDFRPASRRDSSYPLSHDLYPLFCFATVVSGFISPRSGTSLFDVNCGESLELYLWGALDLQWLLFDEVSLGGEVIAFAV